MYIQKYIQVSMNNIYEQYVCIVIKKNNAKSNL